MDASKSAMVLSTFQAEAGAAERDGFRFPRFSPLTMTVVCPVIAESRGARSCIVPEVFPTFRPFTMNTTFRSRMACIKPSGTVAFSSCSGNSSARTSSPSTTSIPSGTVFAPMPPPNPIIASPPPSANLTLAKGITAVSPTRMGSPTTLPIFNCETSLSKSAKGWAKGAWALASSPQSSREAVNRTGFRIIFMMVSSLGGRLADANEARPFLADRDKSQGPGFAAHEEPIDPHGQALRRCSRRTARSSHAHTPEADINHHDRYQSERADFHGLANHRLHVKIVAQTLGQGIGQLAGGLNRGRLRLFLWLGLTCRE